MNEPISIFWFRRDLRLEDNAGLYHALKSGLPVVPVFVFDTDILNRLENKADKRVDFIHQQIVSLKASLRQWGSDLRVYHGAPEAVWKTILSTFNVNKVFANHDYEPEAIRRDEKVKLLLTANKTSFHTYKDQCIFEKTEVCKDDGSPYTVFTPYAKKWKVTLNSFYTKSYPTEKYAKAFFQTKEQTAMPTLTELGFEKTDAVFPIKVVNENQIRHYTEQRNFPSIQGTSRLGIHLRFGTISIRAMARQALALNETFLNELIWRDFYMMILASFPHVATHCFRKEYEGIPWRNNEEEFEAWCLGKTGYPIVDAGMRELNETGFMHNRVRMITASFLTKHLLIDWRWGEAYFAQKLLDYDLSANNGGWQWAAGCGTDAAPYFRVFNPTLQTEKFDSNLVYIKKWIPELSTADYPKPIVVHEEARKRCLEVYKIGLASR